MSRRTTVLGGCADDNVDVPFSITEARQAEAGGDAGRRDLGAAAAGRQRDGQGARAGVPVAEDAGHRRARDARRISLGAKGVAPSYVSRVLRLTLLAPDIVEAILDGRQPAGCSWMICCRRRIRNSRAGQPKLSFGQLTLIRRGIAFSAFGSTSVITPSLSSALIPSCSILLEI